MISGVVLAAGTSSRLGRPKQLLDLAGRPLVRHVVDAALASTLDEVVIVVGHAAEAVRAVLPSHDRLRTAENRSHTGGQSTSLIAGLRAVHPVTEAIVVLLGDQATVRASAIDAVVDRFRRGRRTIVQASYSGTPGHPTLLARELWPEVEALTGDEGARSIVRRHRAERALVEMGGPTLADVDTEEDYRALLRAFDCGR